MLRQFITEGHVGWLIHSTRPFVEEKLLSPIL